jgi:hypothetical protein
MTVSSLLPSKVSFYKTNSKDANLLKELNLFELSNYGVKITSPTMGI